MGGGDEVASQTPASRTFDSEGGPLAMRHADTGCPQGEDMDHQPFNPQWTGDRPRVDLISLGRRDLDEQRLALEAAEGASWRRFVAACPTFEQVGPLAAAHFAAYDEPTITDLLFGRWGCRHGADELRGRGIDGSGRARITDCPDRKHEGYAAVGPGGGIVVVDRGVSARGRMFLREPAAMSGGTSGAVMPPARGLRRTMMARGEAFAFRRGCPPRSASVRSWPVSGPGRSTPWMRLAT